MESLAPSSTSAQDLILSLVESWEKTHTINGVTIAPKENVTDVIFDLWRQNQGEGFTRDASNMELQHAPFRLLAITNRIDLNNISNNSAGEGRLTFGLTHDGSNDFTLIFEYDLKANEPKGITKWVQDWHSLSAFEDRNSEEYINRLVKIVESFTSSGSDLNQIRTNEVIGGAPWELREFNLVGNELKEVSRKQSPDSKLQRSELLKEYITTHSEEILNDNHEVKEEFENQKFLASNAEYSMNFRCKLPDNSETPELEKLTKLSCIGCHGGLRNDTEFTHIKPRREELASSISPFLGVDLLLRREKIGEILKLQLEPVALPVLSPVPEGSPRVIANKLSDAEILEIRQLITSMGNRVH